ncbi:3-oxoacyl-ACP reductase [Endozoicomonas sp. OPT23]|uniref:SDR family NAD(P)-dependent oxidoreductase n=1 Tax=Endozoicomonas sp. OPT23 TaxID=2072845 RepID=UPI00129AC779|nr:glucose 1-dehydrogenase [Endozoicomonas sp. OPT23]MRI34894.1 3-oxoacyl-ACP reductase [Endozoicomonas sp. OPT23]
MGLLDGKKVIVTGAAQGVGYEIANRFIEEGASVAILDLNGEGAFAAGDKLGALAYQVDVTDSEMMEQVINKAVKDLGGLTTLVNNAGASVVSPLHKTSLDMFQQMLDINLKGVFHALRVVIPMFMEQEEGGSIVTIASGAGVKPISGQSAYAASKAAVISLASSVALEYGSKIKSNSLSSSYIETPASQILRDTMPEALEDVRDYTPMGRLGQPRDMADASVFLASDLCSFITGQNIEVDGGIFLAQAGLEKMSAKVTAYIEGMSEEERAAVKKS